MASVRPISITQAKVEEGELSPPEKDEDEEITTKLDSKGSSIKSVEDSSSSPEANTMEPDITAVIVAGRTRCGKTTALNNIFDPNLEAYASKVTRGVKITEVTKKILEKEVIVQFIETPGLGALDIPQENVLEEMKRVTKRKNYVLIYCLSVSPCTQLCATDRTIIQGLHHVLGENAWRKCVLLFTFSDHALSELEGSSEQYIKYITNRAIEFQKLLKTVSSELITVKTIFEYRSLEELKQEEKPSVIIAIPVKKKTILSEDILPNMITTGKDWTDVVIIELNKKTNKMEFMTFLMNKLWPVRALVYLVNWFKK